MPDPVTVNTTDYALRLAREQYLSSFGALDAKRPRAWDQYGYPEAVDFDHLFNAYRRGGAAKGAVHKILDKCWQERPRIKRPGDEEESPWETATAKVLASIGAWPKLRDFDRRNMVGRFAGLILRAADGKALREPLGAGGKLIDVVPVYENQLRVVNWDSDTESPTFGEPLMWQYRMQEPRGVRDRQGRPDKWADVHPSRIIIMAEGSVGSDFLDGVPLLEPGFNALVDLEKVSGGSAESYLKNSARTLTIKFDANASPQVLTLKPDGTPSGKSVAEAMEEKTQALNRNTDSSIVVQGGEVGTLQTQQSDPTKAFEVAANLFAASVQIPFTILFGQQTGRLASDEDQKDFNARCRSRQVNEITPMLERLVERLQLMGAVEKGEFEIEWPDLAAPTEAERVERALKMAQASKTAFESGLTEPLFDANEIRQVAGFDERTDDGMPDEEDLAAEEEAKRAHELALRGLAPGARPAPGAKPALATAR